MTSNRIPVLSHTNEIEVRDLVQRGCSFQARYDVPDVNTGYACVTKTGPEHIIHGLVTFQIQVIVIKISNGYSSEHNNLIFIKFTKKNQDSLNYVYRFSCKKFNITEKCFKNDDTTWRLIHDLKTSFTFSFDVSIVLETVDYTGSFISLYDDKELIDFELRGEDGAVRVHKAVLAASSPVLRRMFEGEWRQTREGAVIVPGTCKSSLHHFKDYMYLKRLPDAGLEQLLLLAAYYMMPELEQKCVDKLMTTVSAQNALNLSEFAVQHKMTRLHLAILECFECGTVKVEEMRDVCLRGKGMPERAESAENRRIRPRSRSGSLRSRAVRSHII